MSVIHYHGTPIWGGGSEVHRIAVAGAGAFVSYARPDQVEQSFTHAKSVAIDNGAFSAWKRGLHINWGDFYYWLEHYYHRDNMSFFVIPDVVEGGEKDNNELIKQVPVHMLDKAIPVWHLHESLDRLVMLSRLFGRCCFGSSGQYAVIRTTSRHKRMTEAFHRLYSENLTNITVHGLRMLDGRVLGSYPLTTADSTNLACNVPKFKVKYPELTDNVLTSDYVKGLTDKEVKLLVLKSRCAVLKNSIEKVMPPSFQNWIKKNPAEAG